MPVDSFKYLPKSFRPIFENADIKVDGSVWAPFTKPLAEAQIAVLSKEQTGWLGRLETSASDTARVLGHPIVLGDLQREIEEALAARNRAEP